MTKKAVIKLLRAERDKLVTVGLRIAGTRKARDLGYTVEGIDWCIGVLEGSRLTRLSNEQP